MILKEIADRSDKVNHPPGDWGRTGAAEKEDVDGDGGKVECRKKHDRIKRDSNENHSLKESLLLVHFKSFRYSDGEQPFCL